MDTPSKEITLTLAPSLPAPLTCPLSFYWGFSWRKSVLPLRANSFLLRVTPIFWKVSNTGNYFTSSPHLHDQNKFSFQPQTLEQKWNSFSTFPELHFLHSLSSRFRQIISNWCVYYLLWKSNAEMSSRGSGHSKYFKWGVPPGFQNCTQ